MKSFVLALILALATGTATAFAREPVRFVVFGDLQEETDAGHAKDLALIDRINAVTPDFSVFVGDIQGGGPCTDKQRDEAVSLFGRHQAPLVFTPGDNEWVDCLLPGKGDWRPMERLARLREALVPVGRSLGRTPMPLTQQAGEYRENARWVRGGVVFVTLHMPGGNNGVYPDRYAFDEFERRNAANVAWLKAAYEEVRTSQAIALVVLFHGNPGWDQIYWTATAYRDVKALLAQDGAALGVPILAVHGDTHRFTIDKPLMFADGRTRADHLTRLEVFGAPERGFVIVTADRATPGVFSFSAVEMEGYGPR